jgi:amino-acid N-acetyltransferase
MGRMKPNVRSSRSSDRSAIESLLVRAGLPLAGVGETLPRFLVAEHAGRIVGAVGLEEYGAVGLLRSAVIDPDYRGTGLGATLVVRLLEEARQHGVAALFLLTTTAEEYFPRFGFQRITRDELPAALEQSPELRGACPASATVMKLELEAV